MTYKAVLFDMDGTILDTVQDIHRTFAKVLHDHGFEIDSTDKEVKMFFGCGIQIAFTRALLLQKGLCQTSLLQVTSTPDEMQETVQSLTAAWKKEYEEDKKADTKPYEGIIALCQRLKNRGIKIGVISNKPDVSVQGLTVQHFGSLFDFVIGESETVKRKPAKDCVLMACEKFHLTPRDVCLIGDTEVDVETANNAGCDSICVAWGFRNPSYLYQQPCTKVVTSMEQLQSVLILEDTIQSLKKDVEQLFAKDFSGHDLSHLTRTMRLALTISEKEGGNPLVIGVAAYLHDIHRFMQNETGCFVSGKASVGKVRELLQKTDLTQDEVDAVCKCIAYHEEYNWNGNNVTDRNTLILQDADNLDAIGAIGIGRSFSYGGSHQIPMYDERIPLQHQDAYIEENGNDASTIHHFTHKLIHLGDNMNTETAKQMAQKRTQYMNAFLEEFLEEWNGNC